MAPQPRSSSLRGPAARQTKPKAAASGPTPVSKNGSQLLHDALIEQGVEVLFGYSGGAILPTFDALYESPIKFHVARCEQGAGHMADGYARAT